MELQTPTTQDQFFILTSLIDHIPHAIFWKDKNLVFRGCNKNFARQFGYHDATEIIGKTDEDFPFIPALREKYNYDDQRIIDTGIPILNYEEVQTQPDGSDKIVLISKVPLYGEDNAIVGVLGIYTDITYIKNLEKQKQENIVNKKIINKLKIIASSLSHEIRTPLAGLKINLNNLGQMLKKLVMERENNSHPSISNEELKEQVARVDKMVRRIDSANSLISMQLKNMVTEKIDAKSFANCYIYDCIEQAIESFPFDNAQQRKSIKVTLVEDFQFFGDMTLTKHVLWNLINNALYFIKEADKGNITITIDSDSEYNILRFKDTAKGLLPEEANRIFSRYYTNRKDGNGSGIGLSFCQLVMEAYGGTICCQAELGEFTEFLLYFPKID
jgi:two-component system aerobic respiration control sensor histidine kinase ArcB